MTRNSKKLQREPSQDYKESEPQSHEPPPQSNQNPFGLSFVVGTDEVPLPSKGKFYPKDSCFYGVSKVEIRHMTAREEDVLSTKAANEGDVNVFDKLLNTLFVNRTFTAEQMLDEDKMALLLKARETGYGKEYKTPSYCEKCNTTSEMTFDLSLASVKEPKSEVEFNVDEGFFELTLPVSKVKVKTKKITPSDKRSLDQEKEKKKDLNIDFNFTLSYLNKIVISANDVYDRAMLNKFFEVLPAADAKYLLSYEKDIVPTISTSQQVECTNCGASLEKEVPLSWAFFRTEF